MSEDLEVFLSLRASFQIRSTSCGCGQSVVRLERQAERTVKTSGFKKVGFLHIAPTIDHNSLTLEPFDAHKTLFKPFILTVQTAQIVDLQLRRQESPSMGLGSLRYDGH